MKRTKADWIADILFVIFISGWILLLVGLFIKMLSLIFLGVAVEILLTILLYLLKDKFEAG